MPLANKQRFLKAWYDSPSGVYAVERLQAVVGEITTDIFGYYALEMGAMAGQWDFFSESRVRQHFKLGLSNQGMDKLDLLAQPDKLPLAFSSVDLVVACHALDFADSAHEVLREIERVLVPEGHCILIGFNPFSFRGMQMAFQRLRRRPRNRALVPDNYSSFRVREWFSVLGFEMLETYAVGFRPPVGGGRIFRKLHFLESIGNRYQLACGNLYVIHVRKRVSNIRLLPSYPANRFRPLLQPGMAVGANRTDQTDCSE